MVQKKVGDHFWGNVPIVPGMRGHDVTKDMDTSPDRLSLRRVKIKTMQHKAKKHLCVSRADSLMRFRRQGIPLKEVAFWLEVLTFGITACWCHDRNLSMPGFQ